MTFLARDFKDTRIFIMYINGRDERSQKVHLIHTYICMWMGGVCVCLGVCACVFVLDVRSNIHVPSSNSSLAFCIRFHPNVLEKA